MARTRLIWLRRSLGILAFSIPPIVGGCDRTASTPAENLPSPAETVGPATGDQPDEVASPPARPDYAGQMQQLSSDLENKQWEAADEQLAALEAAKADLNAEESQQLAQLVARRQAAREQQTATERASLLEKAKADFDQGEFEAATAALERVLAMGPSDEQKTQANELKVSIEDRRRGQRELRSAMRLLSSDKRSDIKAARTQLMEKADAAYPLLLKSLQEKDPQLVENCLEILRGFNKPERTLPAVVAILGRSEQADVWPAAIKELQKNTHAGAGPALLKLATTAESVEQRIAALQALAAVIDPPADTIVTLLPMVAVDGPELPAAIQAMHQAMVRHKQTDLAARRGLDVALSAEQEAQLSQLPERMLALQAADPTSATAQAAFNLAVAARWTTPQPLTGVVVSRVVGEDPLSPAAGVLDGVWQETDAKTMWKHPVDKQASIVIDLGTERTVTGVRLWNYNEANAGYRGWKEVDVFVSQTPALLSPVSEGVLAMAPGAAATADYSAVISVPFVRGRYVKIQPRSLWRQETVSGLTELQILGY